MIELSRGAEREQMSADEKRSALNQILASQTFARSDQLKAFLEFVCEQEFKGEGAGLNEYLIGRGSNRTAERVVLPAVCQGIAGRNTATRATGGTAGQATVRCRGRACAG
jgi:hypothetical protein